MLNSSAELLAAAINCLMATVIKYKFDEFEADLRAAELRKNGNRLKLQMQPFQVLVALLERPRKWLPVKSCGSACGRRIHSSTLITASIPPWSSCATCWAIPPASQNSLRRLPSAVIDFWARRKPFRISLRQRSRKLRAPARSRPQRPLGNPNLAACKSPSRNRFSASPHQPKHRAPLVHAYADHVPDLLSLSAFQLGKHIQGLVQYLGTRRRNRIRQFIWPHPWSALRCACT